MLDKLTDIFTKLKALNLDDNQLVDTISKLVNSPLIGLAVRLSPNKQDDLVLEVLKGLFPVK